MELRESSVVGELSHREAVQLNRDYAEAARIGHLRYVMDSIPCTTECKRNIVAALDEVSDKLGNARAVCRKYHVHPGIITLYEQNNLTRYLNDLDEIEESDFKAGLTTDEVVLMKY